MGRGLAIHGAWRLDRAAQAAVRPEMTGERTRIDPGDRRDPVIAQEPRELLRILQHGGRGVGDDEPAQPRAARLVVGGDPTVVADQRVRHHDDLAGIRGVGADLLVAGLARVDDEVPARRHVGPEGDAFEDGAVLEREQGRAEVTDARVDHGPWLGRQQGAQQRMRWSG